MAEQDAVVFLDDIEQNRLSPALLAWTPLMKQGQTTEIAKRWAGLSLRLGETERRDAATLAWTFAQLTDSRPVWKPVLEAIPMNESSFLREVRNEGRVQVRREDLLEILPTRLSGDHLAAAIAHVEKQNDFATLSRWLKLCQTLSPEALLAEIDK